MVLFFGFWLLLLPAVCSALHTGNQMGKQSKPQRKRRKWRLIVLYIAPKRRPFSPSLFVVLIKSPGCSVLCCIARPLEDLSDSLCSVGSFNPIGSIIHQQTTDFGPYQKKEKIHPLRTCRRINNQTNIFARKSTTTKPIKLEIFHQILLLFCLVFSFFSEK